MSDKEILEKAIQKAIDGGWDMWKWPHYEIEPNGLYIHFSDGDKSWNSKIYITKEVKSVIFDHDFSQSIWGDNTHWTEHQADPTTNVWKPGKGDGTQLIGHSNGLPLWQYRLQQMVISDDPVKYLGENI